MRQPDIGESFEVNEIKYIRIQPVTGLDLYYTLTKCVFALRLTDYAVVVIPLISGCEGGDIRE